MTATANVELPSWILQLASTCRVGGRPISRILYVDLPTWASAGLLWPREDAYYLLVDPAAAEKVYGWRWTEPGRAALFVVCHELAHAMTGRGFHRNRAQVDVEQWLQAVEDEAACDELAEALLDEQICVAPAAQHEGAPGPEPAGGVDPTTGG